MQTALEFTRRISNCKTIFKDLLKRKRTVPDERQGKTEARQVAPASSSEGNREICLQKDIFMLIFHVYHKAN